MNPPSVKCQPSRRVEQCSRPGPAQAPARCVLVCEQRRAEMKNRSPDTREGYVPGSRDRSSRPSDIPLILEEEEKGHVLEVFFPARARQS